mmetsp:Transcript_18141/g.42413  ORF Transcript_18141/g.42413 Transcript_18141/m.42413 type:complete len:228 (+) Transcript_18141:689-1372(+)
MRLALSSACWASSSRAFIADSFASSRIRSRSFSVKPSTLLTSLPIDLSMLTMLSRSISAFIFANFSCSRFLASALRRSASWRCRSFSASRRIRSSCLSFSCCRRSSSSLRRSIMFLRFSARWCSRSMLSRTSEKNAARSAVFSGLSTFGGSMISETLCSCVARVVSCIRMLSLSRIASPNRRQPVWWSTRTWTCLSLTAATIIFSISLSERFSLPTRSLKWLIRTEW